jgi:hydroxyacylglutathione hydrolase
VLIKSASIGPWGTNCHVVALNAGGECIVIDPGQGATEYVAEISAEYKLNPVAILATHGHIDHVWNLYPIATDLEIPTVIHQQDRRFLANPELAVSPETIKTLASLAPGQVWLEPDQIIEVSGATTVDFAGFNIKIIPTPGHTAGSVCFQLNEDHLFTGDLLFKNAIGRTDLFSGDPEEMNQSLRLIMKDYSDDVLIFPGHGENSTIGAERSSNPYVRKLAVN